jgi:guanylate kinase
MSRLLVISAPSGAGKTTLCARLLKELPELVLSISCTTRAPRGQEQHGREYIFLSKDEFERKIQSGEFAEWARVHGNYYGTLKSVIDESFARGKSVLFDIDVQGAESLRQSYPKECFTVFVAPPSLDELERRLRGRGTEAEEAVQRRLQNARDEMAHARRFDAVIVNDSLDRAYDELKSLATRALDG